MSKLQRLRYHAVEDEQTGPAGVSASPTVFRGDVPAGLEALDPTAFNSDADAARFYLDALVSRDDRPAMRSILAPTDPANVPELVLVDTRDSPRTKTTVVRFEQRHESIPIFGSHAIVELTRDRELVSADASVGDVHDVPTIPTLSAAEAVESIADLTDSQIDLDRLPAARLVFYEDDAEKWHLAWLISDVPAAPPEVADVAYPAAAPEAEAAGGAAGEDAGGERYATRLGHLPGPSPRDRPRVNYLVDAHHGEVLFYYSAAPVFNGIAPPPIPVQLKGLDELGDQVAFWGNRDQQAFLMADPLRRTQTFDLEYADLATGPALPQTPISRDVADWLDSNRAAISAHVNAQRVHDFYKGILQRNGIDDGGMTLISVVNCTWEPEQGSRDWANAVWWDRKMWYGQMSDDSGRLVSLSRYLDVIAHELTHGVIDFSSNLIYQGESGALNESYADIFGVTINNWYRAPDRADVSTWDWEIGAGFRADGRPLRDMSDPTRTGDPDHYDDRYTGTGDYGGVHINSGIVNKAAFNLLTGQDDEGNRNFSVEDAALLFYLCMTRLSPGATFADARAMMTSVARTYYSGDLARADRQVAAIEAAYDAVGVSE